MRFVIVIIAFEKQATIAQVVERNIGNVEVTGPTPVSSFYKIFSVHAYMAWIVIIYWSNPRKNAGTFKLCGSYILGNNSFDSIHDTWKLNSWLY